MTLPAIFGSFHLILASSRMKKPKTSSVSENMVNSLLFCRHSRRHSKQRNLLNIVAKWHKPIEVIKFNSLPFWTFSQKTSISFPIFMP